MVITRYSNYGVDEGGAEGETLALRTRELSKTPSPSRKRKSALPWSSSSSVKRAKKDIGKVILENNPAIPDAGGQQDSIGSDVNAVHVVKALEKELLQAQITESQDRLDEHEVLSAAENATPATVVDVLANVAARENLEAVAPTPSTKPIPATDSDVVEGVTVATDMKSMAPVEQCAIVTKPDNSIATISTAESKPTAGVDAGEKPTAGKKTEQVQSTEWTIAATGPESALGSSIMPLDKHTIFDDGDVVQEEVDAPAEAFVMVEDAFKTNLDIADESDDDGAPETFKINESALRTKDPVLSIKRPARRTRAKMQKMAAPSEAPREALQTSGEETVVSKEPSETTKVTSSSRLLVADHALPSIALRKPNHSPGQRPAKRQKDVVRNGTTYRTILDDHGFTGDGRVVGITALPPKSNPSLKAHRGWLLRGRKLQHTWGGRSSFTRGVKT